jgi:hypothetical protein
LPLPLALADNAAMETESIADLPKRKRCWFQFSLRTLLIGVVPYVAAYALVLSLILSDDGKPKPVGTAGNLLYDLCMAKWEFAEAMGAEIARNMAICFTIAWIGLPILLWAIWRSASRLRRSLSSTATQP